ncbi:MAG: hypothetical protein EBY29_14955 [Planctomycetes bacterium]|nr:hypothetical protein [Planctomycetota bacterium]
MMIEQTCPIIINDKFVGIGGADRSLKIIDQQLRTVCNTIGVEGFLISSGRETPGFEKSPAFIAATTDEVRSDEANTNGILRTHTLESSPYAALFGKMRGSKAATLQYAEDPDLKTRCLYASLVGNLFAKRTRTWRVGDHHDRALDSCNTDHAPSSPSECCR